MCKKSKMEIDPMDDRELYNKYDRNATTNNQPVSTTISSIIVQGGPLQLVIALLRVRIQLTIYFHCIEIDSCALFFLAVSTFQYDFVNEFNSVCCFPI